MLKERISNIIIRHQINQVNKCYQKLLKLDHIKDKTQLSHKIREKLSSLSENEKMLISAQVLAMIEANKKSSKNNERKSIFIFLFAIFMSVSVTIFYCILKFEMNILFKIVLIFIGSISGFFSFQTLYSLLSGRYLKSS